MTDSLPGLSLLLAANALLLLDRRDFGLAILGKEIIEGLCQQGLYGRLTFRREQAELLFDGRRKIASHVGLVRPARPVMRILRIRLWLLDHGCGFHDGPELPGCGFRARLHGAAQVGGLPCHGPLLLYEFMSLLTNL